MSRFRYDKNEDQYYDQMSFLTYDNEHHRIAIANTSEILKDLNLIERMIMKFKLFLNKKIPSIQ